MNKTIVIPVTLICAALLSVGMVWYIQTKPIIITQYIPPVEPPLPPSPVSATIPEPSTPTPPVISDTRSWGERMRDPAMPDVPGVIWQTYTNKEYRFEMEYPKGWEINTKGKNPDAVDSFYFYSKDDGPDHHTTLTLSIFGETLREFASKSYYFNERFKNQGMIPDTTIHGIDVFIMDTEVRSDRVLLGMIFEKEGHIYGFNEIDESFEGRSEDVDKIIEHMIKTFHFLK